MVSVPLPDWVQHVRPHQKQAVKDIVAAFDEHDVVFLDAPTGSGKTLIAELVRRELSLRTLYVCSDKGLQDQFKNDFPYAKLLKGRANYPVLNDNIHTADDCTNSGSGACWWCDQPGSCPYIVARDEASVAELAVTNTSYLLTEANHVGRFSGFPFVIVDEADTLEKMLMGFVEYTVSPARMKEMGVGGPNKSVHKPTLIKWLDDFSVRVTGRKNRESDPKKRMQLQRLHGETLRVAEELRKEIARPDVEGKWLREYDTRGTRLTLKPVTVDSYGTRQLWRHGKKWLLMSATIISADEMADSLGLPKSYATVKVPMTFPVENRPIIMAPVANVVYSQMGEAIPKLVKAINRILLKHPTDRVLVHTVSYSLAEQLQAGLRMSAGLAQRRIVTYKSAAERERALKTYKDTSGCVLLAPSMARGVDLPGDLCRVQVVAKTPFLSLKDTQVSKRMRLPGGDVWYAIQTVRDMVQMTGRGVRSKDDYAITYVLDQQFASNLYRKHRKLFPEWWQESVVTNQSIREFL